MNDAETPVTQITCKWNHLTEFAIAIEGTPSETTVVGGTVAPISVEVSGAQWLVIFLVIILGLALMFVTLTWKEEESEVVVRKQPSKPQATKAGKEVAVKDEVEVQYTKKDGPKSDWKSGGLKSSGLAIVPDMSSESSCKPEEDPF